MKFLRFINGGGGIVYHSPGLWILAILEVETGKFEKSFIIKKKEKKLSEKVKGKEGICTNQPISVQCMELVKN